MRQSTGSFGSFCRKLPSINLHAIEVCLLYPLCGIEHWTCWFIHVCLCECVCGICMHACMCVYRYICTCVSIETRSWYQSSSSITLDFILGTRSLNEHRLDELADPWAPRTSYFYPPILGLQKQGHAWLLCGCRDLNLGPRTWTANVLPTELSALPVILSF